MFLLLAIALLTIDVYTAHGISLVNNYIGNPFFYLLGAITGSFAMIFLCSFFGKIPVVTYLGENSMAVLCAHGYIMNIIVKLLKLLPISSVISSIIVLVLVSLSFYIIVPFFKRYIPWAIGEK